MMKSKLQLNCFFTKALLGFIIYVIFFECAVIKFGLPALGIEIESNYIALILIITFISASSGAILFGLYFVKPIFFMMSLIKSLSEGNYDLSYSDKKLFTKKNKLKNKYLIYKDFIPLILNLGPILKQAEEQNNNIDNIKKDWISELSHNIKTPLSYVIGYSALLLNKDYSWREDEKHTFLTDIYANGKAAEDLIGDLNLSFKLNNFHSSIPLVTETFDFIEFIKKLISDVSNDPRAIDYDLGFSTREKSCIISADLKLLQRAFQNIIINAVLYNPKYTKIDVYVRTENDGLVYIYICDDGVGMEKEALNNLFTGYSAVGAKSGTSYSGGFGLAIVKNIIEAHGGHLSVDSVLGKGNVFHITLPIKEISVHSQIN